MLWDKKPQQNVHKYLSNPVFFVQYIKADVKQDQFEPEK